MNSKIIKRIEDIENALGFKDPVVIFDKGDLSEAEKERIAEKHPDALVVKFIRIPKPA
jgi:hypothetical protein